MLKKVTPPATQMSVYADFPQEVTPLLEIFLKPHKTHTKNPPPQSPQGLPGRQDEEKTLFPLKPGGQSAVVPPGPVPNPEVKRCRANGSRTIGPARVGRRRDFFHQAPPVHKLTGLALFLIVSFSSSSDLKTKEINQKALTPPPASSLGNLDNGEYGN